MQHTICIYFQISSKILLPLVLLAHQVGSRLLQLACYINNFTYFLPYLIGLTAIKMTVSCWCLCSQWWPTSLWVAMLCSWSHYVLSIIWQSLKLVRKASGPPRIISLDTEDDAGISLYLMHRAEILQLLAQPI